MLARRRLQAKLIRFCRQSASTGNGRRNLQVGVSSRPAGRIDVDRARKVTAAVNKLGRQRSWEAAIALAASATDVADLILLNAAVSACAQGQAPDVASSLLEDAYQGRLNPGVIAYSSAISSLEGIGNWAQALELFRLMCTREVVPDLIAHNAVASVCRKGHQWAWSLELMKLAMSRRLQPDNVTYSTVISACEKGAAWAVALDCLRRLWSSPLPSNVIPCNAAISACDKGQKWAHALWLLKEARELVCS